MMPIGGLKIPQLPKKLLPDVLDQHCRSANRAKQFNIYRKDPDKSKPDLNSELSYWHWALGWFIITKCFLVIRD